MCEILGAWLGAVETRERERGEELIGSSFSHLNSHFPFLAFASSERQILVCKIARCVCWAVRLLATLGLMIFKITNNRSTFASPSYIIVRL
jgi:hypothetical protein